MDTVGPGRWSGNLRQPSQGRNFTGPQRPILRNKANSSLGQTVGTVGSRTAENKANRAARRRVQVLRQTKPIFTGRQGQGWRSERHGRLHYETLRGTTTNGARRAKQSQTWAGWDIWAEWTRRRRVGPQQADACETKPIPGIAGPVRGGGVGVIAREGRNMLRCKTKPFSIDGAGRPPMIVGTFVCTKRRRSAPGNAAIKAANGPSDVMDFRASGTVWKDHRRWHENRILATQTVTCQRICSPANR
jgi:hypothetical protein